MNIRLTCDSFLGSCNEKKKKTEIGHKLHDGKSCYTESSKIANMKLFA